jgi:hypothetical protein
MIGNISQTGKYIAVTGGAGSNYINNSNYMGVGQIQYNTSNQRLELYNGTSWQPLNLGQYYVGLNPDAEQILDWAREKMHEELFDGPVLPTRFEPISRSVHSFKNGLVKEIKQFLPKDNLEALEQIENLTLTYLKTV